MCRHQCFYAWYFLQGKQQEDDANFSIQQCILGTHTSGAAQNYLILAGQALAAMPAATLA
jgi:hypothetical protein